jgi:hypothetical protein
LKQPNKIWGEYAEDKRENPKKCFIRIKVLSIKHARKALILSINPFYQVLSIKPFLFYLQPVLILMSDFGHFDRLFATMTEKFERRRSLCPRASEARRVSQDEKRGIRSQLSLNFLGAASSFEVCFTTGSGSGSDTPKNPERLP